MKNNPITFEIENKNTEETKQRFGAYIKGIEAIEKSKDNPDKIEEDK